MIRRKYRTCDFCGKETNKNGSLIILRRKKLFIDDDEWRRTDICDDCAFDISIAMRNKRKEREAWTKKNE